jgi:Flp pilus assembly pilin Flp
MRFVKEERGSTAVLFAVLLASMVGFAALAVDVGHLYNVRAHLSATADAAAEAGAQELPDLPQSAVTQAQHIAQANGVAVDKVQTSISSDSTTVTVTVSQSVPLTFARILGLSSSTVGASAAARHVPLTGARGVAPFGVVKQSFQYGQLVALKDDSKSTAGDSPGNFHCLALGGRGANVYGDNITSGYAGWIRVNDWVETEPGNMSGPTRGGVQSRIDKDPNSTYDQITPGTARILTVPVLNTFQVQGRSVVQVVGFASFFLETNQGGQAGAQVNGRFLRWLTEGEANGSGTNYGTATVKLIQ